MKIKQFLQVAALVALAGGIGPAYSAVWQWSKTAASNGTADPTLNWAEGMSPSSVNDSARAQLARTAEWRDDISGSVATGGILTAYTLATNQAAGGNGIGTPPTDGQMLAFRATVTNGTAATLAVDGGTAYPLQTSAGTAAASGTLIAGTPYRVSFNLANSSWVIEGGQGNPYSIPLGGLLPYTAATAPNSNFILPAGQCISTVTYATYWALMGSPGVGACPGGQFAVVDLRGRTLSALDNLNGSAASRMTAAAAGCGVAFTSVGAVCGSESQTLTLAQSPAHAHTGTTAGQSNDHTHNIAGYASTGSPLTGVGTSGAYTTLTTGGASADHTHTFTTSTVGSGTAHPIVQPTMAVTYLLRVI